MQNTKLIKKISTSLVSTGEIIDSLQSNSSTNAPSIRAVVENMTPPMNLLINGDFQIWQRGESFTIEGDEAFHYTADMWCVYASTGQTITVNKTTDGLQFSGTSTIMQRMSPLKVGQKYVFLCKVDGDFKTLSITGGTYTENSFLKYNKAGSYEQLGIKSNGITNVANARLWEGDTVYKIVEEDDAIALLRCQDYEIFYETLLLTISYDYNERKFQAVANFPKMKDIPTFTHGQVEMWANTGSMMVIGVESKETLIDRIRITTQTTPYAKKSGTCIIFLHNVNLTCEPL